VVEVKVKLSPSKFRLVHKDETTELTGLIAEFELTAPIQPSEIALTK